MTLVGRWCEGRLGEATQLSRSFPFVDLHVGGPDDPASDSCKRVLVRSASEVPFPWLKRVRLDLECKSEVRLTSAVRHVHANDHLVKSDC